MDGFFLIALIVLAAASAALLWLCAALGANEAKAAAGHDGLHNDAAPGNQSAAGRGL